MQAGPKASGRNLRYEHVFLQDCKRESAYRRSANAAKQTHTHTDTLSAVTIYIYIINYHKVFSKTWVLSHWISGPCTFSRQHRLTWRLLVLTSLLLGISFSWPVLLLTVLSLEISFFWHFFLEGKQMQKATVPQQFALPSNSSAALQNTRTHNNTHYIYILYIYYILYICVCVTLTQQSPAQRRPDWELKAPTPTHPHIR